MLLRLAGVDDPDLSIISTAPAVDSLICDFRLWSATSPAVQRQHIATVASLVQAEAGVVNVKRLRRFGAWLTGKKKLQLLTQFSPNRLLPSAPPCDPKRRDRP